MPANSETIRISVDLPREMYFIMHTETERNGQTHAGFTRKAIEEKLIREKAEWDRQQEQNTQK